MSIYISSYGQVGITVVVLALNVLDEAVLRLRSDIVSL